MIDTIPARRRSAAADAAEAERQALIAHLELEQPVETPNNIGYTFYPRDMSEARRYFRRSLLDWSDAYLALVDRGLLDRQGDRYVLTPAGACLAQAFRRARPPIYYWYVDFYRAIPRSRAHAALCERLFGRNLGQDGFAELEHLDTLSDRLHLRSGEQLLDLGCGGGGIAAYLSETSGARVVGMDYIAEAIRQARRRAARDARLGFLVGNLDGLPFAPRSFDAIVAVDSLYMPNDLAATLRQMRDLLRPGGRMGLFYSFALWEDASATAENLRAEHTPLGAALRAGGLHFDALDFTAADYAHACRKQRIAEELREEFAAEDNLFIYEVQAGTAAGIRHAIEAGQHARYLYLVNT